MTKKIELYDTTLRDGTQQEGISLSVEDKLAITKRLDDLGIDIIEGGYAGANPQPRPRRSPKSKFHPA